MIEALPEFAILRPTTIDEAVAAAAADPGSRYLAGGTDLIVNMRRGLVDAPSIIDLSGIEELRQLRCDDQGLLIGAGVTLAEICGHQGVRGQYRAVAEACETIAGPSHRVAATVGGNVCLDTRCLYYNQSHWWRKANDYCLKYRGEICHVAPQGKRCRAAFCGDLAPALLVLGAAVEVAGPDGRRHLALADLYQEDGADHLQLDPGELITTVRVNPPQAGVMTVSAYEKVRVRGAIDFPLAGVAVACDRHPDGAIALTVAVTGTNSRPILVEGTGSITLDQDLEAELTTLEKLVQKQVSPQRTTIAAAHYRRLAAAAIARRLVKGLVGELRAGTAG